MRYDDPMPSVIYESPELLVLNKPTGLITHSDGRTQEPSLAEWIAERYPAMTAIGAPWVSPQGESISVSGLVHRLDRPTSGIMLAARTPGMYDHLKSEFKARRITKTYRALVMGHVESEAGRIVAAIERSSTPPKRWYAVPCDESHVRAAITDYTVLARGTGNDGQKYTYVELKPHTGRTHQIRVHMASTAHPLAGEHLYGEAVGVLGFAQPALHALSIAFTPPAGERVEYRAPLPEAFEAVVGCE